MNIDSIAWFQFATGALSGYTVFMALKRLFQYMHTLYNKPMYEIAN